MRTVLGLSLLASLAAPSGLRAQAVVDTCGQIVNGSAVLAADLDCADGVAVRIERGVLDLRGFTLTGYVLCAGLERCRLKGPGTVVGGVLGGTSGGIKVSDLSMIGLPTTTYMCSADKVKLLRVSVSGYPQVIPGSSKVRLVDSQLTGSPTSTIGVSAVKATLVRSSITGFVQGGMHGLYGPRLVDSTVTGNGVDISSGSRPTLRGTSTCGTSLDTSTFQPWGVCTND